MCINALSDCLDEIGRDQIICVRASPIQPLPVPHLRFRPLTPVENPHCYAMLCCAVCCLFLTPYPSRPVVSVAVVWPFNPFSWTFSCRLFLIFAFRDFRISHSGNWQLATGEGGHVQYSGSEDDEENNKHWNQGGERQMAK